MALSFLFSIDCCLLFNGNDAKRDDHLPDCLPLRLTLAVGLRRVNYLNNAVKWITAV